MEAGSHYDRAEAWVQCPSLRYVDVDWGFDERAKEAILERLRWQKRKKESSSSFGNQNERKEYKRCRE